MSKKRKNSNKALGYDTTVSLLNTYLAEWMHRDQFLWSKAFKLYYAILIIILLPNIANFLKIELPNIAPVAFRITGLLFSFVFLYITLGYVIRFNAISDTYQSIINELPKKYRRKSIKQYRTGKLFSLKLNCLLCIALFLSLFILSIVLIIV